MKKLALIAAALAVPMAVGPASAQDDITTQPVVAKKDWYNVVYFDFKPGMTGEAMELIEAFQAVDTKLGRDGPIAMRFASGEWDMMVAFKMDGGIAEMGWESNPAGREWDEELARQLGGADAVKAHWKKFNDLIARSKSEIAYIDLG